MEIAFDSAKNARNIRERGLPFERAGEINWDEAEASVDDRREYGETRYVTLCYLDRRLHVLCFTETPNGIRVISFRKANSREARKHGKPLTLD